MVMGRFLSGFPWEFLGVSQYKMLPLIQIASSTGVYGVSFLIIWFSVALMLSALAMLRNPRSHHAWVREISLPMLAVAACGAFGFRSMQSQTQRPTVKVALIQPSIPQTLIWDERENANRFDQLMALSERALAHEPDLMIWPEASVPNMLRHHIPTGDAIVGLVKKHQIWAILGSDDAEYRKGTGEPTIDYYNSAFSISPQGRLEGRYTKRQLVIFGEYMPFAEWLPFLRKISPAGEAGFTAGKGPAPFQLNDLDVTTSVLICFEDTFPHLVREYVHPDTDFLVNLTNNGWFGESAAQWQHAATAVFRAVENRVPLVRCANNGLTCWVDETGAMHDAYFEGSSDVYKAGYKISEVPVLRPGQERRLTFYTRHGDVFGWACLAFSVLAVAVSARRLSPKLS
jgi:apolipoprotein N-acyltransferase